MILFETIANQQKAFPQKYEGEIVGIHLIANHHHKVPTKLQTDDESIEQKCSPVDGKMNVIKSLFIGRLIQLAIKIGDLWHKNYTNYLIIEAK